MNYQQKYRETYKGRRVSKKYSWKKHGLVGDIDAVFDIWWNATNCHRCNVLFAGLGVNKKCMDHDHATGEYRAILCHGCNLRQLDCAKRINNTSGYKHIHFDNSLSRWVYTRRFNDKLYVRARKNKIDVLVYKFCMIMYCKTKFKDIIF